MVATHSKAGWCWLKMIPNKEISLQQCKLWGQKGWRSMTDDGFISWLWALQHILKFVQQVITWACTLIPNQFTSASHSAPARPGSLLSLSFSKCEQVLGHFIIWKQSARPCSGIRSKAISIFKNKRQSLFSHCAIYLTAKYIHPLCEKSLTLNWPLCTPS